MSRKLICSFLLCLGAASSSLSGCTSDEAPVRVELCGDLGVPEHIDAVRVVIYDPSQTPLREGVRELWSCPGPTLQQLPQALEFEPVTGDVFISVQGLKDGVPVVRSELRTDLSAQESAATVSLSSACLGVRCADGETCVGGRCELVSLVSAQVSDCAVDDHAPGGDAATEDATTTDAAISDAADASGSEADAGGADPAAYLCPQPDADDGPEDTPRDDAEEDA